jgi:hypothetical protein
MSVLSDLTLALNGETPERTPFSMYEWLLPDHETWQTPEWLKLLDQGLGLTFHRETVKRIRHGMEIVEEERVEQGQRWHIQRWKTPVGDVQQAWRDDWHVEYLVKKPQDYRVLQWIVEHTENVPNYEPFNRQEELIGERGIVLPYGWRTPAMVINVDWAGTERFCEDVALEVPEMFDLFYAMRSKFREETEIIAAGPGRFVKWLENLTVSMLGPRRYNSMLVSVYDECVPILERSGKRVMVHYDGALSSIARYIAGAPFHMIESLTEPPEGDMTYADCRAAWPDKALWGNINLENYYLAPDDLRAEVIAKRNRAGKRGFAFELSEDLPVNWCESIPVVLKTLDELG